MPESTSLDDLIRQLNCLSIENLHRVASAIQAIIEARLEVKEAGQDGEEEKGAVVSGGQLPPTNRKKAGRGGHYELKTIKGHQYWYLRWRDNGIHRSTYVGKTRTWQN